MLSNFIRWNGKRKGNKMNGSPSHQKSHSASASLISSPVLNINEVFSSQSVAQRSGLVEPCTSGSNEEWFPHEFLRSGSESTGSFHSRSQSTLAARYNLTQETRAESLSELSPIPSENNVVFRKKSIPAPILIPDADLLMPNVQIGNSAVPSALPPIEVSQSDTNHASSDPPSPSSSDNLSVISGTTLPHALIGASFVLSSTEYRNSRRRSGVVRQDSATLPRGEVSFLSDSRKASSIPPVPPVPVALVPPKPSYPLPVKSGTSTESEYPILDSHVASPEIVTSSVVPQRTSLTQEISSPVPSTSTKVSPSVFPATTSQQRVGPVLASTRTVKGGGVLEAPLSVNSQETTQHSPQEESDDHGLDEFDFISPEPFVPSMTPNSGSSPSNVVPLSRRSGTNRGQRKRRVGRSNPIRKRCMIGFLSRSAFGSKSFFIAQDSSLTGGIPTPHQSHGMPSATTSEHDYGELLSYDLTVSPESGSSAVYQTFPETPMAFSPLWLSEPAKIDGQVPRRHSRSIKSAGLRSTMLSSSMRTARRQLDNRSGPVVPRGSRSTLFPGQQTPPPKQAEPKPSLAQLNDEAGIPDETIQPLTTDTVGSQDSVEFRSALQSSPLARISSSSSILSEGQALQVLAPLSALSPPSLTIANVDASFSLMTVPSSVVDKSLTSVPLPDSTGGSPFGSPGLADGVMAVLPLTVSSPPPSNSPFSYPPSSLGGSSDLPSPSPSASLSEPFSQPAPPIPISSPSAVSLDDWVSTSLSLPPPPYHTIVSERVKDYPGSIFPPSLSRTSSTEHCYQHRRQASNSPAASGSVRSRGRARPPLPIGPRKPSRPGQTLSSLVPNIQGRNGSTSSVASGNPTGSPGSLWHKLQSAVSKSPPKFHSPPPKWRGLTLEAAQWTFTSAQLQEMVSRAIQQASEGSSLRLLRLEILDGEIEDEVHRLELQHMDVKAQYKELVRRRWTLMGVLAGHIEGVEMNDTATVSRTMEELVEVLLALDRLADKMHDIVLRTAQLKSLRDVHNASALAMAVRKINGLFVRQMAEKERLQEQVSALQTERDEAWKHAEDIAQDYDTLNDRMSGTAFVSEDARVHGETQSLAGSSKRSTRISAVRKSSVRLSQAGLRSRNKYRSTRSSSSITQPTSPTLEGIPPVPRLLVKPLSLRSTAFPAPTGKSVDPVYSSSSPTSDALALAEAQREVYGMLGLSLPPSQASSRRRTLSDPDPDFKPPSLNSRPMSDPLTELRVRHLQRRGHGWGLGRGASSSLSWTV